MDRHPGPVLGGGRPGGGQAGAGHLYWDDSGGDGGEVGAGGSFQGFLHSSCWSSLFLAGENQLAGHFSLSQPGPRPHLSGLLGAARCLELLGGGEADVPHALEFLSLPHEAPGTDLPLLALVDAVATEAGDHGVVGPLRSLYLDLNLFGLLRNVQAGVIFLLLSQSGGIILLPGLALLDAVREVEVVRDIQTDRSLSSLLSQNSAVWIEVRPAGRAPHRLP